MILNIPESSGKEEVAMIEDRGLLVLLTAFSFFSVVHLWVHRAHLLTQFQKCRKEIGGFISKSFDEYAKQKSQELEQLAEAKARGDSAEVRRIVERL